LALAAERGGAGSGASDASSAGTSPGAADALTDAPTWRGGARERLPLELELASRRYFEASPAAPRAPRR
jgi:hypothetical protein